MNHTTNKTFGTNGAIIVDGMKTSCDGGGSLGHPKIYLELDEHTKTVKCPYCGQLFMHKDV